MEMRRSDSSGTDDDLPPSHSGHVVAAAAGTRKSGAGGGGRLVGNGKAAGANSMSAPRNIDQLVRVLEQDAYTSVLRAFGAQSEHITWAKERLMSELRKELRVTDEQHRDFLARVAKDESIGQIREWRESGEAPVSAPPPPPAPPVPLPRKKQKTGTASMPPLPPPPPPPPQAPLLSHPPPASKKGGAVSRGKSKGNSDKARAPSQGKKKDASSETQDRWVGQSIKMRWPADNHFYEAYVKEFHKEDGTHTLVYDMGTQNETSERVDLSTMAPEDIQSNGMLERQPLGKKKNPSEKSFKRQEKPGPSHKTERKASHYNKLPSVESLARQVEELEREADLTKIEHAKRIAKEHEETIRKALLEVGESSDEEESKRVL